MPVLLRRTFLRRTFAAGIGGGFLASCGRLETFRAEAAAAAIRLSSRPGEVASPCEPGQHALKIRRERDALFYVPKSADPAKPAPLLVYLHGATGDEQQGIRRFSGFADQLGFLVLSPASESGTWDAIQDSYGRDVKAIDQALGKAFGMRRADPARIGVCGFSDGASYALGLGISNGELFRSVAAFSPGFVPPGASPTGKPRLFVSHGVNDQILPIDSCSRRLVPEFKRAGYDTTYREFDGPHTVPREIAEEALRWFLG